MEEEFSCNIVAKYIVRVFGFNLHKSDKNRITGGENVATAKQWVGFVPVCISLGFCSFFFSSLLRVVVVRSLSVHSGFVLLVILASIVNTVGIVIAHTKQTLLLSYSNDGKIYIDRLPTRWVYLSYTFKAHTNDYPVSVGVVLGPVYCAVPPVAFGSPKNQW